MIRAFFRGMKEFRSSFTFSYVNASLSEAYDWGREWAHRLTFRRFEE